MVDGVDKVSVLTMSEQEWQILQRESRNMGIEMNRLLMGIIRLWILEITNRDRAIWES